MKVAIGSYGSASGNWREVRVNGEVVGRLFFYREIRDVRGRREIFVEGELRLVCGYRRDLRNFAFFTDVRKHLPFLLAERGA